MSGLSSVRIRRFRLPIDQLPCVCVRVCLLPEPCAEERQRLITASVQDVLDRGRAGHGVDSEDVAKAIDDEPTSTPIDSTSLAFMKRLSCRPRQCLRCVVVLRVIRLPLCVKFPGQM